MMLDAIAVAPAERQSPCAIVGVARLASHMECGLTIKNFNDIRVGDVIEAFEEEEVRRTL